MVRLPRCLRHHRDRSGRRLEWPVWRSSLQARHLRQGRRRHLRCALVGNAAFWRARCAIPSKQSAVGGADPHPRARAPHPIHTVIPPPCHLSREAVNGVTLSLAMSPEKALLGLGGQEIELTLLSAGALRDGASAELSGEMDKLKLRSVPSVSFVVLLSPSSATPHPRTPFSSAALLLEGCVGAGRDSFSTEWGLSPTLPT